MLTGATINKDRYGIAYKTWHATTPLPTTECFPIREVELLHKALNLSIHRILEETFQQKCLKIVILKDVFNLEKISQGLKVSHFIPLTLALKSSSSSSLASEVPYVLVWLLLSLLIIWPWGQYSYLHMHFKAILKENSFFKGFLNGL